MRLKEDKTNWNASSVQRKLTQPPEEVKHRSRKDRRRWCKGVPGREHDWTTPTVSTLFRITWHSKTCRTCGKQLYY